MSNVLDYLRWRGDLPLSIDPFNEVDGLILSQLSYIAFDPALSPDEAATLSALWPRLEHQPLSQQFSAEDDLLLLELAANSPRFGPLEVWGYVREDDPQQEKQFAAITFRLPDDSAFVSFRGTDSTLVGWKEDFNLMLSHPVPAQLRSAEYLTQVVQRFSGPVKVGGHSKGGNLALYAATAVDPAIQWHITDVYVHDGPGLSEELFGSEGYARIQNRLHVFLPERSVVGILLMHPEEFTVVKSTGMGILQHDPYSWQVLGTRFERADGLSKSRVYMDQVLKKWLSEADEGQLRIFVDTVFQLLGATEATTLREILPNLRHNPKALLTALRGIDSTTRQEIGDTIGSLAGTALQQAEQAIADRKGQREDPPEV